MPATEAQIAANRRNAQLSTGPKTAEGKERSRQNGVKHGLSGAGVVVPESERERIEARKAALEAEMAPRTAMGQLLVGQIATLSVRVETCFTRENAMTGIGSGTRSRRSTTSATTRPRPCSGRSAKTRARPSGSSSGCPKGSKR